MPPATRPLGEQRLVPRHRRLARPCYPAHIEPPEYSERLTWAVCCTVGAIVGLSAVPLVLLLRPIPAFVALGLALIAGSWLWERRP